jgi:hypothetical protein
VAACEELYRQLWNPQLFLVGYGRICSNAGAMTLGDAGNRGWHFDGQIECVPRRRRAPHRATEDVEQSGQPWRSSTSTSRVGPRAAVAIASDAAAVVLPGPPPNR